MKNRIFSVLTIAALCAALAGCASTQPAPAPGTDPSFPPVEYAPE